MDSANLKPDDEARLRELEDREAYERDMRSLLATKIFISLEEMKALFDAADVGVQ